uniref:Uncharacterized protein n=1 Tax=Arundo donax TaxID=35708 RepID=A0A0A8Z8X8_ARUDO
MKGMNLQFQLAYYFTKLLVQNTNNVFSFIEAKGKKV